MYIEKKYRDYRGRQNQQEIVYKNADILLTSETVFPRQTVLSALKEYYSQVETYVQEHPEFQASLSPVAAYPQAPQIIQDMSAASFLSTIGPFSAVAGAIAHYVGMALLPQCRQLIIENGGDLFLKIDSPKRIGLYAGEGSWVNNLYIEAGPSSTPFGIAASSGTMGHSLSLGNADLVIVAAESAIIADTFVTILCNRIKTRQDIHPVMECYKANPVIRGIGICLDEEMYVWNLALGVR